MSHRPIVTNRVLRNQVTGIDIFVPDYIETSGKISSTASYNVIVITKLFYYKTKQHKESDLVQFMVQKQYEEFEELYQKLTNRFPSVSFPSLPRKSLLVSSNVLNQRRKVMDEVLQMVARMQKLCCSPMVLQFLGVNKPKSSHTSKAKEEATDPAPSSSEADIDNQEVKKADLAAEGETQFEDVDLFMESTPSAASRDDLQLSSSPSTDAPLFSEGIGKTESPTHQMTDDQLFVPSEAKTPHNTPIGGIQDHSDLFDIPDDFEDLLALSKKSHQKSALKSSDHVSRGRPSTKGASDSGSEDVFSRGRVSSYRKQRSDSDTLDDIFGAVPGQRSVFGDKRKTVANDDEDDDALFSKPPIDARQPTKEVYPIESEQERCASVEERDGTPDPVATVVETNGHVEVSETTNEDAAESRGRTLEADGGLQIASNHDSTEEEGVQGNLCTSPANATQKDAEAMNTDDIMAYIASEQHEAASDELEL